MTVTWGSEVSGIIGKNERCIEWPLALDVIAMDQPGRVLDVGCAMNRRVPRGVADLTFVNKSLKDEPRRDGFTYLEADVRDLPFGVGHFDRAVCVSTLEHVGGNNGQYGGPHENDFPSADRGVRELLRVTRGPVLITVPYESFERRVNGIYRHLPPETIAQWAQTDPARSCEVRYYARRESSWEGGWTAPANLIQHGGSVAEIACLRFGGVA